jgi:hypothetical protein
MRRSKTFCLLGLVAVLAAAKTLAQGANFGELTLARGFDAAKAVLNGHTGGSYSLSSLANSDRRGNPCIGYASPTPDHVVILKNNFSQLKLEVVGKNKDLTLVVRGPNKNRILCGFAANSQSNTVVEDSNWKLGAYEVWVGSVQPGKRLNYRIKIEE